MSGHRKANLSLVNHLFNTESQIMFEKVNYPQIKELALYLKNLKDYVDSYYTADELLQEETKQFMTVCNRVFGTIQDYYTFFRENDNEIKYFINFTKRKVYLEIFRDAVEPIINIIRELRNIETNAFLTHIDLIITSQKKNFENTVILTRNKIIDSKIQFGEISIRIMNYKQFLDEAIFVDNLIFIGTSNYFDKKFSELFYAHKIYFMAYSIFENNLYPTMSFEKIIPEDQRINTIYRKVKINPGIKGVSLKEISNEKLTKENEEIIVSKYEMQEKESIDFIETKLAFISNNNYVFLPTIQKINVIDRDTLKITQAYIKEIEKGDLLLFRTKDATTFIRDIADEILGKDATIHRQNIEKWKYKLREIIELNGIQKVSRVFRKKYKLDTAYIYNIKYWVSNFSIKPKCLPKLLNIMNFKEEEQKSILSSAKLITSAHISAGRKISNSLMNELDQSLESIIEEKGYYTFESLEFKGVSFNIEEIQKLSEKNYFIAEKDILKIIKS